jgi:hypothetical protein
MAALNTYSKVTVKLALCLVKHCAMKTYEEVEI